MKHPTAALASRVKFKKPPINELVIGLYYVPIVDLKAQHVGLYWERIKDRFPICEQKEPIGPIFEHVDGELFPLPRFWFYREAASNLVQLQRNAFIYNWRRCLNHTYPHYENVYEEFLTEFNIYQRFLHDEVSAKVDVIRLCELTYINIISTEGWSKPSELGAILPPVAGFQVIETESRSLIGLNSTVACRLNENLQVDVSVKTGKRKGDSENLAILEIKGHGAPDGFSVESVQPWYDAAHDAIYDLFLTFTDKEAQQRWEPML